MGHEENFKRILLKRTVKIITVFLLIFLVFFLYQRRVVSKDYGIIFYIINILVFIVFILSIYSVKYSLYLFIFFIPLLNSLTIILGVRPVPIILFLFFPLCLGFYIKNYGDYLASGIEEDKSFIIFDSNIKKAVVFFILIFSISSVITIFRYSNFYPFITNRYYDLVVNVNGIRSTGSIFWTIRFFFNYIIGFSLLFIVFNTFKEIRDIIGAIFILMASTLISTAIGLYQFFFNPYFGNIRFWVEGNRLNATFTDPNALGSYTLLLFPLLLSLFLFLKKWYFKLAIVLFAIPFLMNMFFSGSRSAFLGLCVSLFIFFIVGVCITTRNIVLKVKESRKFKKFIISVSAVVVIILSLFISFYHFGVLAKREEVIEVSEEDIYKISEFVTHLYQNIYERAPDEGGLGYWVNRISSGGSTGAVISKNFITSDEFIRKNVSDEKFINILFKTFYGREPDAVEYNYWLSELESGKSREELLSYFANSDEFKVLCKSYNINPGSLDILGAKSFTLSWNNLFGRISSTFRSITRMLRRGEKGVFQAISSGRYLLWSQAIDMFKDYPISGVGLGAYIIELPNYYVKNGIDSNLVDYTGNYYLQILSELGLPGLILILFVFYLITKKVFMYFRSQNYIDGLKGSNWLLIGFFISFISMIVAQFFGPHTNFTEIQFTFWLIIGLMLTYIRIKGNSDSTNIKRDYSKILGGNISKDNMLKNKIGDRKENQKQLTNEVKKIGKRIKILRTGGRIKSDLVQKISLSVIIIIFSVSFFISSFSNLSINVKQNLYGYENKYGFYEEEISGGKKFRWTNIDASESIEKKGSTMTIPMRAGNPDIDKHPLFVRIYIDNFLVKVLLLRGDYWRDVEIGLPNIGRERVTLTISVSRCWNPEDWGVSGDSRDLGIAIGDISFKD
ncbi:hypothetical protein ES707_03690 [subsurface metagenome]